MRIQDEPRGGAAHRPAAAQARPHRSGLVLAAGLALTLAAPAGANPLTEVPGARVVPEEVPPRRDAEACGGLPSAYVVRLNGFPAQEVQAAEEYMAAFRCYEHHRPVRASGAGAEYWYESRSDSARLGRNLRLMLEHMSAPGQVQFSGNALVISRVATRQSRSRSRCNRQRLQAPGLTRSLAPNRRPLRRRAP